MAEYLIRDVKLGLSTLPESAYNQMKVLASDFLGFQMTGTGMIVPDVEKFDDTGKIGAGNEFATEQRSGYVLPSTMSISDELNTGIAAMLAKRAFGGDDLASPTVVEASTAYGHDFAMQANTTTRQLPSSSVVYSLGGADFVWAGCVVDKFGITQTRSGNPTFTADLMASGLNKRIRDISPTFGTVAAPATQHYMQGAETSLQFTDSGTPWTITNVALTTNVATITAPGHNFGVGDSVTVNSSNAIFNGTFTITAVTTNTFSYALTHADVGTVSATGTATSVSSLYVVTGDQRLKAVNIQLDNAHITDDRRPGDPRVLTADMHKGWYVNRMLHGDRKVTADFTVPLDDKLREYFDATNDRIVTGFIYTARGYYIGASTTNQFQFQLTVPKCYFRTPKIQANGPDAEMNISIFPVEGASFGLITCQIQNERSTSIV
jgi:hypothetical protein